MKQTQIPGVYQKKNKFYTKNPESCKGTLVYNEQLLTYQKEEYRSWNPYRSKLAAALHKGLTLPITPETHLLYLGAATGTTLSHLSDMLTNGVLYAVENSPVAMKELLELTKQRANIIPILQDAFHPERYQHLITPAVDMIYQDISQRNQVDILLANTEHFLKPNGTAVFMIKPRSINVAEPPKTIYQKVQKKLSTPQSTVHSVLPLQPYEKDHAAFLVEFQKK